MKFNLFSFWSSTAIKFVNFRVACLMLWWFRFVKNPQKEINIIDICYIVTNNTRFTLCPWEHLPGKEEI